MTKTIEKDRKRKHNLPRGILTPTEEMRLRKGNINRQLRHNIRLKTSKTIMTDLPLIFDAMNPQELTPYYLPIKPYLKKIMQLHYNLIKSRIIAERHEQKVKHEVSFKEVWKHVARTIREAKREIQEMEEVRPRLKPKTPKGLLGS
jgi:hypothetical protein